MVPGRLWWSSVLNLAFSPQGQRADTWLVHEDPVSHMAQKKRDKERKKERKTERNKETKKQRKKEERKKRKLLKSKVKKNIRNIKN